MPAGVTAIDVPTQGGRTAARDRAEDGSLLRTEPRMLRDEGVTLRVEDIGHLHGRPAHGVLGGLRRSRDRGSTRPRHLELLQRIRRGLQVPSGEVQIDGGVRQVRVPEQYLDCPQVGAGFQEVSRIAVSEGMGADVFVNTGRAGCATDRIPITLAVSGLSARQPFCVPGKRYVCGCIQRQVLAQRGEQRRAQRPLTGGPPLPDRSATPCVGYRCPRPSIGGTLRRSPPP